MWNVDNNLPLDGEVNIVRVAVQFYVSLEINSL